MRLPRLIPVTIRFAAILCVLASCSIAILPCLLREGTGTVVDGHVEVRMRAEGSRWRHLVSTKVLVQQIEIHDATDLAVGTVEMVGHFESGDRLRYLSFYPALVLPEQAYGAQRFVFSCALLLLCALGLEWGARKVFAQIHADMALWRDANESMPPERERPSVRHNPLSPSKARGRGRGRR